MLERILQGTIRKKLAVLFLFAALPAMVIIMVGALKNRDAAIEETKENLRHFCLHIAQSQDKTTLAIKTLLENLARLPEVGKADVPACEKLFSSVLKINPVYGALHLVDLHGDIIASSSTRRDANFAHTRHFRQALQTKAFATGEFLIGVTLQTPVFTFGHPVLDEQGEVTGVLLTSIRLEHYGDIFQQSQFPADSFIGVCDHKGTRLFRFPQHAATPVGAPIKAAIFSSASAGPAEGLIVDTGSDGVRRIHAYRQLRLAPDLAPYMYIFVGSPESAFYADAKAQLLGDFRLLFLALGLTLLSGWFLGGRTVSRRLEDMAAAARRIGDGDLAARVRPAPEIEEMDVLARAFNTMAEGLSRDIMRREKAEEALRASEQRHKIIIENSPLGMIFYDSDGKIVDCNRLFVDMMGSSRERIIGFNTALHGGSTLLREKLATALAGEAAVFEDEYTSVTGRVTRSLRIVFNPISPGQAPTGVIATVEDVSERKQAEKALLESEARFRNLFEQVPSVAVQGYDMDGTTIYWNTASENLYGYTKEEAIGKPLVDLIIPPDMRAHVASAMRSMAETGTAIPAGELSLVRKDGSLVSVYSSHVILKKPGGELELFCLDVDLTSIRQAEAALLKAKEDAVAANRAKSEFLANMSHEIRTPINGVLGMLQLMETTALDDEQLQYVRLAVTSVTRLNSLLADILDLSRIEAGKLVIRTAEFRPADLKEAVLGLFSVAARNKGVALECTLDPELPQGLVGDETRLRQVLFNLVGNALKFTDQGRIEVGMYLLPPSANGDVRVLFSVSDTGIGIPADRLQDIFEPFRQVENSYTRSYQGAGLGLAIVQRLVTSMAGNINIESEPGEGTEVHIVIPFSGAGQAGSGPRPAAAPAAAGRKGLRVLLVEDEPSNQFPVMKFLEQAGHEPTLAENGSQALEILSRRDFDIILMDIQMPVMDGVEATRAIRESRHLGDRRDIPIIALTAYAMSGDREKFLSMGMNGYLSKPVTMADIARAIDEALTAGRWGVAPSSPA
jgi:PAS domain S-box-containing protein